MSDSDWVEVGDVWIEDGTGIPDGRYSRVKVLRSEVPFLSDSDWVEVGDVWIEDADGDVPDGRYHIKVLRSELVYMIDVFAEGTLLTFKLQPKHPHVRNGAAPSIVMDFGGAPIPEFTSDYWVKAPEDGVSRLVMIARLLTGKISDFRWELAKP